jgi:hypothetical protein
MRLVRVNQYRPRDPDAGPGLLKARFSRRSMHLLWNIHLFPHAFGDLTPCSYGVARELACLKTARAF